ncbi:MAG: hypothetical protein ACRDL0_00580 [Thermoleophilaceae bacterium]
MDYQENPSPTDPSRLLIAADPGVDPHRLVRLCCERGASDPLGVSLLVPSDHESAARSDGSARAVRLLGQAAALLDAAGFRLEDLVVADDTGEEVDRLVRFGGFDALLVCAPRKKTPSPALSLAVRLARLHGVTIIGSDHQPDGHAGWLRRVLDPLASWPRPG